jgi:hypothetical protein
MKPGLPCGGRPNLRIAQLKTKDEDNDRKRAVGADKSNTPRSAFETVPYTTQGRCSFNVQQMFDPERLMDSVPS